MALRLQCDRPDIIYVTSTVNVRNVRMLAVNRRLGYREIRRRSLVQAT
jgi:RimJ/RimL family protein N-acetyltransferase